MKTENTIDIRSDFGYAIPTIHLNGSSKESLMGEWLRFKHAIEKVCESFPSESFHGRNHYTKGDEGHENSEKYAQALVDHFDTALSAVEEILDGIQDQ